MSKSKINTATLDQISYFRFFATKIKKSNPDKS